MPEEEADIHQDQQDRVGRQQAGEEIEHAGDGQRIDLGVPLQIGGRVVELGPDHRVVDAHDRHVDDEAQDQRADDAVGLRALRLLHLAADIGGVGEADIDPITQGQGEKHRAEGLLDRAPPFLLGKLDDGVIGVLEIRGGGHERIERRDEFLAATGDEHEESDDRADHRHDEEQVQEPPQEAHAAQQHEHDGDQEQSAQDEGWPRFLDGGPDVDQSLAAQRVAQGREADRQPVIHRPLGVDSDAEILGPGESPARHEADGGMKDAPDIDVLAARARHRSGQQAVHQPIEQREGGADDDDEENIGAGKQRAGEERRDCEHKPQCVADDVEGDGVERAEFPDQPGVFSRE